MIEMYYKESRRMINTTFGIVVVLDKKEKEV